MVGLRPIAVFDSLKRSRNCFSSFMIINRIIYRQHFPDHYSHTFGETATHLVDAAIIFLVAKILQLTWWKIWWTIWRQLAMIKRFYPNVTTLRSAVCYRKSVCRLSVRSCIYSACWNFRQCFYAILYPIHPLISMQNLRKSSQRNPVSGIRRKRGSQI